MNIVFINTQDNKGGAARFTYSLMKELEKRGHNVSMFVRSKYSKDPNIFEISSRNFIFKILSAVTRKDVFSLWRSIIHRILSNDIAFFNNKNLMDSEQLRRADIVHCNNLHGNYFNLKNLETISKVKPIVWALHDMWALTTHNVWEIDNKFSMEVKPALLWNNQQNLLNRKISIYKKSNIYPVGASKWIMDKIANSILKDKKSHLIYNGINTNVFKPVFKDIAREKLGLPKDKKIAVFMSAGGKYNPQKGWDYAKYVIEQYKDREDILFLCIGGKELDSNLDNKNIKFIEYVSDEEKFALYYSASDVLLHTALAEAFCLVAVEALGCGIPVVAFPVGITPEIIRQKENGYVAPYMNQDELVAGLDWAFNLSIEEKILISRRSHSYIENNFNIGKMVDEYEQLYSDLIKK